MVRNVIFLKPLIILPCCLVITSAIVFDLDDRKLNFNKNMPTQHSLKLKREKRDFSRAINGTISLL